jgi:hypothetical protein
MNTAPGGNEEMDGHEINIVYEPNRAETPPVKSRMRKYMLAAVGCILMASINVSSPKCPDKSFVQPRSNGGMP